MNKKKMLTKKDALIMSYLRKNAREKITTISRETAIPVTTIYDRVRAHDKEIVSKHVSLLDFQKMGFNARAKISIKVNRDSRIDLQEFLVSHTNVNSLYKTNYKSDFLADVVFKNTEELSNFVDNLETNFDTISIQVFSIISEIRKEELFTRPDHWDLV